jgi:putative transposase
MPHDASLPPPIHWLHLFLHGRRLPAPSNLLLTRSGKQRSESTIWQRRFWEHQIRDAFDMEKHVDYIHFNPVKHGQVQRVGDWPYSTFHRYVREGIYVSDWAGTAEIGELDLE